MKLGRYCVVADLGPIIVNRRLTLCLSSYKEARIEAGLQEAKPGSFGQAGQLSLRLMSTFPFPKNSALIRKLNTRVLSSDADACPSGALNQIPNVGSYIKDRGGSKELANMFVTLVDYYAKYHNSYIKHDDAVIEEEIEFVFEITASFMKHLIRLCHVVGVRLR